MVVRALTDSFAVRQAHHERIPKVHAVRQAHRERIPKVRAVRQAHYERIPKVRAVRQAHHERIPRVRAVRCRFSTVKGCSASRLFRGTQNDRRPHQYSARSGAVRGDKNQRPRGGNLDR